ncbi:pinin/SDK/memA/ protein conserved region-domain-containing protein [Hypoxylon sp. NC1633]|nr:pinin/SDK/memA/ protein conserved region-domain-containing protein [Hypoxylon sp. NC1633]
MPAYEMSPNGRDLEREKTETTAVEVEKDADNSLKRKALPPSPSEDKPSQSPKRAKLDDKTKDEHAGSLPTPREHGTTRRESAIQEEKRRGKRLFGGLLNTLSQTASNSQQKKRQDIERRQQAKAHQQTAQVDKHREDKLAKLRAVRQVEQFKFDERVMETSVANMRTRARFLVTKSIPEIFYLPWDPTDEQKAIIKNQRRTVEEAIDAYTISFERRKEQKMKALGIGAELPPADPKESVGNNPNKDRPTNLAQYDSTNRPPSRSNKVSHEKEPDRADDVMIEEVEDTVIY